MATSTNFNFWHQLKITLWWGLLIGLLAGAGIALYETWFANYYIQKGLSVFVLVIFSKKILASTGVAFVSLLILGLGVSGFSRWFLDIRNPAAARLSLIAGSLVLLIGGYFLNKSEWFPAILSLQGILGNFVFSLVCAGLMVAMYKFLLKTQIVIPVPGKKLVGKLYGNISLFIFVAVFLLFNLFAYWRISTQKPANINLVFITIDTLRADRLGCYGYERDTSPTIDKLASAGARFSRVYAQQGLTWPSLTSIMTAMYPKTHGVLKNQWPLHGKHITLAEILKNAGYKTGAFVANYYYAPNRGFDVKKGGEIGNLDKSVTRDALEWLNKIEPAEDNFFMWVHYKNPHDPYTPPKPFTHYFDSTYTGQYDGSRPVLDSIFVNKIELPERDLAHINALYDAEIRSTDSYLARLLDKLEEMGVSEKTLIVFSADHGEELYEHNAYFFHGCSMYEGVLHIPLIFKYPGVVPAGKVVDNQIESIDIIPTILELLKVPLRPEFEGRSALTMLFEGSNGDWRAAFGQRSSAIFSIRTPEWKYIYNPDNYHTFCSRSDADQGDGYIIAPEELYDLKNDPREQNNLVELYPDIARDLRGQIIQWLNTNRQTHKEQKLTKAAEERLRALGYIK
ncbi:MAG: sulfatase [bacterium]